MTATLPWSSSQRRRSSRSCHGCPSPELQLLAAGQQFTSQSWGRVVDGGCHQPRLWSWTWQSRGPPISPEPVEI